MLRLFSLASGSAGNATIVLTGDGAFLIDIGIGPRILAAALDRVGIGLADLRAAVITHEHGDHCKGLEALLKRTDIPVYLTRGTARCLPAHRRMVILPSDARLRHGGTTLRLDAKSHDTPEPVFVSVSCKGKTAVVITDLGEADPAVAAAVAAADLLLLESNHDPQLLARGPYPPWLQQRIRSARGHLSNAQAADLVRQHAHPRLGGLILAHLSETNNTPTKALAAMRAALAGRPELSGLQPLVAPVRGDGTGIACG
jgi:phosphoribosyl 1,2-cyclic phosphodiesterase